MSEEAIATLLDQEAAAGNYDSSGSFSLDIGRAATKLNRFRATQRYAYLLALVRSAVAGRASSIRIECRKWSVWVTHDGDSFSRQQLETLAVAQQRGLRELALAVAAAPQNGISYIRVSSIQKAERHDLTVTPGGTTLVTSGNEYAAPGIRFEARKAGWTRLFDTLRHFFASRAPEEAILDRCLYCPVPIFLNDCPAERPVGKISLLSEASKLKLRQLQSASTISPLFGGDDRLVQRFLEPEMDSHDLLRGDLALGESEVVGVSQDWRIPESHWIPNAQRRMLAYLALEVAMEESAQVTWVRDGVRVGQSRVDLGCPGVVATVSMSDLDLDLNRTAPVENERYHAMLDILRAELQPMREEVFKNWTLFPPALGEHLRRSLEPL